MNSPGSLSWKSLEEPCPLIRKFVSIEIKDIKNKVSGLLEQVEAAHREAYNQEKEFANLEQNKVMMQSHSQGFGELSLSQKHTLSVV